MITGGCRCGAIRYQVEGEQSHHALCHCRDCQMGSGAPMVAWIAFRLEDFRVTQGVATVYNGTGASQRYFCPTCGTPLYFLNPDMLPGLVDIQTVTLDHPEDFVPQIQVQVAERQPWMSQLDEMPEFARFPGS